MTPTTLHRLLSICLLAPALTSLAPEAQADHANRRHPPYFRGTIYTKVGCETPFPVGWPRTRAIENGGRGPSGRCGPSNDATQAYWIYRCPNVKFWTAGMLKEVHALHAAIGDPPKNERGDTLGPASEGENGYYWRKQSAEMACDSPNFLKMPKDKNGQILLIEPLCPDLIGCKGSWSGEYYDNRVPPPAP